MGQIEWAITITKDDFVMVDAEMAKTMLQGNQSNRRLNPKTVQKYAVDMRNGDWNGYDPIVFSSEGKLINGQHRLNAVIASKSVVPMIIYQLEEGMEKAVFDRGKVRSVQDTLQLKGVSYEIANRTNVSVVGFIFDHLFLSEGRQARTDSVIGKYLQDYSPYIIDAVKISKKGKSSGQLAAKAPIMGAIYMALRCGVNKDVLEEMFKVVNTGFTEQPTQYAAIVLRNYIIENKNAGQVTYAFRKYLSNVTQQAIEDYVKGYQRKKKYDVTKSIYDETIIEEDGEWMKNHLKR